MKRQYLLAAVLLLGLVACSKVLFTGRSQAQLYSKDTMNAMALGQYTEFLQENPPLSGGRQVDRVGRVGRRIQAAVENYYIKTNDADHPKEFNWEFNVVDDPQVNAWAMPGGKVVVYTGILPITRDDNGLAVVMGHEIAHALAHHGNERMSQQMAVQLGGMALETAAQNESQTTKELYRTAYGIGAQVGAILPFSRLHESEADEIGLYIMAMAGYDPEQAAPFWDRMNASGGQRPPEFLSTHPSPENRSRKLQELIPKAREYAQKYPLPGN